MFFPIPVLALRHAEKRTGKSKCANLPVPLKSCTKIWNRPVRKPDQNHCLCPLIRRPRIRLRSVSRIVRDSSPVAQSHSQPTALRSALGRRLTRLRHRLFISVDNTALAAASAFGPNTYFLHKLRRCQRLPLSLTNRPITGLARGVSKQQGNKQCLHRPHQDAVGAAPNHSKLSFLLGNWGLLYKVEEGSLGVGSSV